MTLSSLSNAYRDVWRTLAVSLSALVFLTVGVSAEDKPMKGVALVIGQSSYENLAPLANPENDADALDELLSDLGFETDLVRDADEKKLARAVERFVEDAENADVALVYYSGHGIEAGGENFILPVDANEGMLTNASERLVSISSVVARLQAEVPVTIVLLDACRTNPFPAGTTIRPAPDAAPMQIGAIGLGTPRGAASLNAPKQADGLGAVLGFAAAPGQAALDGEPGHNSPYAAALLKHLSAGGYAFSDLMTMVSEEVYLRTDARQVPWTNSSLRRLLYFGDTVEEGASDESSIRGERRKLLLTLAAVPDAQRRQVATVSKDSGVPMDALFAMLKAVGADTPQDPDQLSRLLTDQATRLKSVLDERGQLTSSDPEITRLASLATDAVREGALDTAITFHERAKARIAELDKTLADAEANLKARRLEHGAVFAASGDTYALAYDYAKAASDFAEAFGQVERWDDALALKYKLAEAQALSDLGFFRGDDAALDRSATAFRDAASRAPIDRDPTAWADTQSGLAIALWSKGERQPGIEGLMSARKVLEDALKTDAIKALPSARAHLQADLALVLLTIGMREAGSTTLAEGVAAARAALEIKTQETAPQEWARLQNHLGAILFVQGQRESSADLFNGAEAALKSALTVWTPETTPLDWANAQNNLGLVIGELGSRDPGSERLLEAVELLKSALTIRTREMAPLHWAESLTNLGSTYYQLGLRDSQTTNWFDQAAKALRDALQEITHERDPLKWAAVQDNLGLALSNTAGRTGDTDVLEESISIFKLALLERTVERVPLEWAASSSNLANALYRLGEFSHNPAKHQEAAGIFKSVLAVRTRDVDEPGWARTQNNLANVLFSLGNHKNDTAQLKEAAVHYRLALEAYPREVNAISFADTHYNLALLYLDIGKKTGAAADFDQARTSLKLCADTYHEAGQTQYDSFFQNIEASIEIAVLEAEIATKLKAAQK